MDYIDVVMQIIGAYGFPITVCAFLLWERYKVIKEMISAVNDMKSALQQNNSVISLLTDFLRKE